MLKPATSAKQSQSFWKLYGGLQQQDSHPQHHQQQANQADEGQAVPAGSNQLQRMLSAAVIDANMVQQVLPGVQLPDLTTVPQQPPPAPGAPARRRQQKAPKPPAGWSPELSVALLVQAGITLQVGACRAAACVSKQATLCCAAQPIAIQLCVAQAWHDHDWFAVISRHRAA